METIIPKNQRLEHVQEYYFARKLAEVNALIAAGKPVINLGVGDPVMQPSPATISALTNSAAETGAHGYQPYRALPELRETKPGYFCPWENIRQPGQSIPAGLPLPANREIIRSH